MSAAQLLCTHCAAEKWNLAAAKLRANPTPENRAAAVAAMHEHKRAVVAAKSPALYAAAPELLAALQLVGTENRLMNWLAENAPMTHDAIGAAIAKAEGKP